MGVPAFQGAFFLGGGVALQWYPLPAGGNTRGACSPCPICCATLLAVAYSAVHVVLGMDLLLLVAAACCSLQLLRL